MDYVRPFDPAKSFDAGTKGYRAQTVSHLETALIIGSWIESGGCGPDLHYHDSDQSYFLVRGEMDVQLGEDVHHIAAGAFVHIPAGLAHRNWNVGPDAEFHFELIVPAPTPGMPLLYPVKTPDEAPGSTLTGYVRTTEPTDFATPEAFPGMGVAELLKNDNAVVNAIRVAPGGEGPPTHIHDFDQYYVVLKGALEVEVALQRHHVEAGTVVLLPAGVPHRQWNEGAEDEMHLALLAPAPLPGIPWDYGVTFSPTGEEHSG